MKSAVKEMERNATLIDKTTFDTQNMVSKLEHQFDKIRKELVSV